MRKLRTIIAATALFGAAMSGRAQQIPEGGSATDFSSVDYFEAPNQQQIKSRMSGANAEMLAGGLLLIKKLELEEFDEKGKLQFIITAPECVYDPTKGVANSAGPLHLRTGDGQLQNDGEGFLWQQNDSLLTISNQVQTVIDKTAAVTR
jgi:hypothetical protein